MNDAPTRFPRRADYLIQEAAGLRSEIIGHQTARYSVDQFGLTGVAAIYAWTIATSASVAALWLPPVIAVVIAIRQWTIYYAIKEISAYLEKIEKEIAGGGWEASLREAGASKRISYWSHFVWSVLTVASTALAFAESCGIGLIESLAPNKPVF